MSVLSRTVAGDGAHIITCYDISKRQIKDHKRLNTYLVNRGSEGRKVWYDLESSKFSEDQQRCWVARLKFVSMLSRLSLSKGIALDLKSQIAIFKKNQFFSRNLKKNTFNKITHHPSLSTPNISFPPSSLQFRPDFSFFLSFLDHFSLLPILVLPPLLMLRYLRHLWLFLLSMA